MTKTLADAAIFHMRVAQSKTTLLSAVRARIGWLIGFAVAGEVGPNQDDEGIQEVQAAR